MKAEREIVEVMAKEDLSDEQKEMAVGYIERNEEDSAINAEWEAVGLEVWPKY